jgi:hypothetical protein
VSKQSPIADYITTDTDGGFVNLRAGESLGADEMLCHFYRAELETVPVGCYHLQKACPSAHPPHQIRSNIAADHTGRD